MKMFDLNLKYDCFENIRENGFKICMYGSLMSWHVAHVMSCHDPMFMSHSFGNFHKVSRSACENSRVSYEKNRADLDEKCPFL